jgi:hypothetical protein
LFSGLCGGAAVYVWKDKIQADLVTVHDSVLAEFDKLHEKVDAIKGAIEKNGP